MHQGIEKALTNMCEVVSSSKPVIDEIMKEQENATSVVQFYKAIFLLNSAMSDADKAPHLANFKLLSDQLLKMFSVITALQGNAMMASAVMAEFAGEDDDNS